MTCGDEASVWTAVRAGSAISATGTRAPTAAETARASRQSAAIGAARAPSVEPGSTSSSSVPVELRGPGALVGPAASADCGESAPDERRDGPPPSRLASTAPRTVALAVIQVAQPRL